MVCFDEVSGISFDQKDGVNIMKGYMESGEFSRGKESIRADGSIVLVGNFDVDVEHLQRVGHLFGPMPPEMRDDTAFMDRIHAFLPGWDVPKINKDLVTDHFGLVSDFLSECWSQLRNQSRVSELQNRVFFGGALSGRDTNAVNKTVSGLHEFTVQLRAFDAAKSGAKLGVASLVALCTSLLKRSVRGGLIIVGEINLGGSIEPVHNAVTIAEIAVEKGATSLLMPVACRRQLVDLSDDMATKIDIQFFSDAKDALLKAMAE